MKETIQSACGDIAINRQMQGATLSELSEQLRDSLKGMIKGNNLIDITPEGTEPSARFALHKVVPLLYNFDTRADFEESLRELQKCYRNRTAIIQHMPYKMSIPIDNFLGERRDAAAIIKQFTAKRSEIADELWKEKHELTKRLSKFKFKDLEDFEEKIQDLVKFKIPLTDTKVSIVIKSSSERTLTIKEVMGYGAYWATLSKFLGRVIPDWVLLKAALTVAFVHFFWMVSQEFFHIRIEDAGDAEIKAMEALRAKSIEAYKQFKAR